MNIPAHVQDQIKSDLEGAGHGEKRKRAELWASKIINPSTEKPISVATLYRQLDLTNGKKKCTREPEIEEDIITLIGKIKIGGYDFGPKGRMLTTEDAIEEAEMLGLVPEGLLTVATVDRRLREAGWNEKRSYDRHEDEYVNQVHHMDFSRSDYFEAGENENGELIIKVNGRNKSWDYKNKPKPQRLRLWLASIVDSFSRAMIATYVPATGENLQMAADSFGFFWQRKDESHPMVHLPDVLKVDQGSIGKFLKHHQHFSKETGIRIELSASKSNRVANHQSQGKVERNFRTMWQRFELKVVSRLTKMGIEEITLEDLNSLVHDYCTNRLEKKHPVRAQSIGQVYQTGLRKNNQRLLKTDINDLLFTENTRVVSSMKEVSIDNTLYKVPEKFAYQRIKVFKTADGRWHGTSIDGNESFDLIEFDPDNATGRRIHEPTLREKIAASPLDLDGKTKLSLVGKDGEKAPRLHTLPPIEEDVNATTPFQAKKVAHAFSDWKEAKLYICRVFDCRWDDLSEPAQDIFERLFDAEELTKKVIEDLKQTAS